jgi:TonB family protein
MHDERPAYSQQALFAGIEGAVELDVTVLTDGSVDSATVSVTKSLDKKYGLDDRAIAAARLWRFRPAVLQAAGTPVPCRVSIVITFKIGG